MNPQWKSNPLNDKDVNGNTMAWMGDQQRFRDYECSICGGTVINENTGRCINCEMED